MPSSSRPLSRYPWAANRSLHPPPPSYITRKAYAIFFLLMWLGSFEICQTLEPTSSLHRLRVVLKGACRCHHSGLQLGCSFATPFRPIFPPTRKIMRNFLIMAFCFSANHGTVTACKFTWQAKHVLAT